MEKYKVGGGHIVGSRPLLATDGPGKTSQELGLEIIDPSSPGLIMLLEVLLK